MSLDACFHKKRNFYILYKTDQSCQPVQFSGSSREGSSLCLNVTCIALHYNMPNLPVFDSSSIYKYFFRRTHWKRASYWMRALMTGGGRGSFLVGIVLKGGGMTSAGKKRGRGEREGCRIHSSKSNTVSLFTVSFLNSFLRRRTLLLKSKKIIYLFHFVFLPSINLFFNFWILKRENVGLYCCPRPHWSLLKRPQQLSNLKKVYLKKSY